MIDKIKNLFDKYISAGFPARVPVLSITYYLRIETPQSLRDSSPTSGAILWLLAILLSYKNRLFVGATIGRPL